MVMIDQKRVMDYSGLSAAKAKKLRSLSEADRHAAKSGAGQGMKLEATPAYEYGNCEEVLRSKSGNAFLILGRDRPGGLWSGFGGVEDHPASSAVRITAGMGGRSPKEEIKIGGKLEVNSLNPNNQLDAATIYLSQKTDIDDAHQGFNLARGTVGDINGRSAVAMKADAVRIISRDGGIKLISGGSSRNSQGGRIVGYHDINFIAGNDDSDLQPLVKGMNMARHLARIYEYMDEIYVRMNAIMKDQNLLTEVLMNHVHKVPPAWIPPLDAVGTGTGANSGGGFVSTVSTKTRGFHADIGPFSVMPGFTFPSTTVSTACAKQVVAVAAEEAKIGTLKANMVNTKHNAILPTSPTYIMSKNVWTS